MLRRRNLLIGSLLAILAGTFSFGYLTHAERSLAAREARETVVVVRQRIPALRRLDRSLVHLQAIPKTNILPGAYRSLDEVVGRVTTVALWPGDQVIAGRTVSAEEPEALTARLNPGERGLSVPVEAETAKAVHPGAYVDVVAIAPSSDGLSQVSRLVPAVRVLKVCGDEQAAGGLDPWVMLAVSPVQAQALALAAETGKLRLVLRAAAERPDQSAPAEPALHRPSAQPIEVVRQPKKSAKAVEVIKGVERDPLAGGLAPEYR
ncbi:MAG: Flp pilus assembly protein CpaB [Bacillota bacterium]|nr:Flp pilus assembly protein CpaB [Bacillota bacterium]